MQSTMQGQPSAQPFISNLQDSEPALQIHALKNLNKMVDYAWHEMADSLQRM